MEHIDFNLPPEKQIEFLENKGFRLTRHYLDMQREAHLASFTVVRIETVKELEIIANKLIDAKQKGLSIEETKNLLRQHISKPAHLSTVIMTNFSSMENIASFKNQTKYSDYLKYIAIRDRKTRPEHRKMDGIVLPANHKFWQTHYPPNGYNCRCRVRGLTKRQLKKEKLKTSSEEKIKSLQNEVPENFKTNLNKVPLSELLESNLKDKISFLTSGKNSLLAKLKNNNFKNTENLSSSLHFQLFSIYAEYYEVTHQKKYISKIEELLPNLTGLFLNTAEEWLEKHK